MKLSLQWLKQYATVRLTPQQVAERLTLAGLEVTDRRVVEDDVLFECEVTPNRPDWLSHVGVARELAAVTGGTFHPPEPPPLKPASGRRPSIILYDRKACRRYVGILLDGVTIGPSPAWLTTRLAAVGIRSINNVVDVTNFVLFEMGQPLHAFDADRLAKSRIMVRRATAGETLVTIDGTTRTLNSSILVIADADRPVAVAGIMGGKATEVGPTTRRVLLESAWFDPLVTRRASRALGLVSDASYRFERGVDLERTLEAARRAAAMILEVAGGRVIGGPVDRRTARAKPKPIPWMPSHSAALGTTVTAVRQRQAFERLGCRVAGSGERWRITPPSFRADLKQPADLLEELARLVGYDRLPVTLPRPMPSLDDAAAPGDLRARERRLRELLVASGLDEILTYSLVSRDDLDRLTLGNASLWAQLSGGDPIVLRNPISQDYSILRQTLIVGALNTIAWNLNRRAAGVALFELGRTYHWDDGTPQERRILSIALAGSRPGSWDAKPIPWDVFHAKGVLDTVARRLGVPLSWELVTATPVIPWFHTGTDLRAQASSPEGLPANLGIVNQGVAAAFEIPANIQVVYAELEWPMWWGGMLTAVSYQPLPKALPVTRDIAILVDQAVPHAQIVEIMKAAGGPLVQQSVTLFDRYQGPQVPSGKKSLAYTVVYGAGDRTLTDAEVTAAHTAMVNALTSPPLNAVLR